MVWYKRTPKRLRLKTTRQGRAYLNLGCGGTFSHEWNNLDLQRSQFVNAQDIRDPLPYPENAFDAVYSSHVLEHLPPADGEQLIREMYRVLKGKGVCRVVVPDLERICTDYLLTLNECERAPSQKNVQKHKWMTLELLDQMVRDKPGGMMLDALRAGDFDEEFVKERTGDEFVSFFQEQPREAAVCLSHRERLLKPSWYNRFINLTKEFRRYVDLRQEPRRSGEAHKWMYDRVSLKLLLEKAGFVAVTMKTFDKSDIPDWRRFNLDGSCRQDRPRKPDSLYVECRKALA
jgi:predicted SAM-dependent methyltransferase